MRSRGAVTLLHRKSPCPFSTPFEDGLERSRQSLRATKGSEFGSGWRREAARSRSLEMVGKGGLKLVLFEQVPTTVLMVDVIEWLR